MRENGRQWFQARLRWAVMEEGRGLDHWREAEDIFQSDSREAAFTEALRIRHSHEASPFEDLSSGGNLRMCLLASEVRAHGCDLPPQVELGMRQPS